MAKQPEERAVEILAEMDVLIRSCTEQLEQGREFFRAIGVDPQALSAEIEDLPEDKRREIMDAVQNDARAIEDEVRSARRAADPNAGSKTPGRKLRPMV